MDREINGRKFIQQINVISSSSEEIWAQMVVEKNKFEIYIKRKGISYDYLLMGKMKKQDINMTLQMFTPKRTGEF